MDRIVSVHLDANESVMFARDLEYIKKKTYDTRFPELSATQHIPVSFEAGPGAETITWRSFTELGMAKIIANYADDLPRADVKGVEHTTKVKSLGSSYGYSIQEIRASQMAGKRLDTRKAASARRMIDQKMNKLGWTGDTEAGITGLINNANVTRVAAPNDGTGAATTFASKSPAFILRDLNALVNGIVELTNGVELPDTLLLPLEQFNYLSVTPYSSYSDKTIMTYFKETNQYIKNVYSVLELKDNGVGVGGVAAGADIAIAYRKDLDKLSFEIPIPFEQLNPQERNLEQVVNCHARCAGVIVYYPLSIAILEGI